MAEAISQADFARRRGVSRKTVTQWKAKGLVAMTPEGLVKVEESEWLLADRPQTYRGGTVKSSIPKVPKAEEGETPEDAASRIVMDEGLAPFSHAEAARVKENYLAMLRQLEYDTEAGKVVRIEDVAAAVVEQFSRIRNKFLNVASRVAPRAAALKSPTEVKALIDAEVSQILQELSLDGHGRVDKDELHGALRARFTAAP